jgi:hypothetical protein
MTKNCEVWGSGVDSGFLAGLLAEAGWLVKWVRPPERRARLRPYRFRKIEETHLKRLLLRYGLFKRQFGNALNLNEYYDHEVLKTTFDELADRLRIEKSDVLELPSLGQNESRLLIVNEDPDFLQHWGAKAFSTFRDPQSIWVSELWYPDGRVSNHFSTQILALDDVLLFLDPHPMRGYVLTLISKSLSDNDRALQALLSYKSKLPLFWRSLGLLNNRSRRVDKAMSIGGQELILPSVFPMGQSLAKLHEFSNSDMSDYFAQSLALFERLQRSHTNAVSLYQQSEIWRVEGRSMAQNSLRKAQFWHFVLSSYTASQLCVPVVRKLPEPLRQLLQSPI